MKYVLHSETNRQVSNMDFQFNAGYLEPIPMLAMELNMPS